MCRIIGKLGSGQFGEVCKATWTVNDLTLELAVKMLISGASEEDKIKFLQEAAIMGQFSHPNVIKLHGVVTVGEPVSCVYAAAVPRLGIRHSWIRNPIIIMYVDLHCFWREELCLFLVGEALS